MYSLGVWFLEPVRNVFAGLLLHLRFHVLTVLYCIFDLHEHVVGRVLIGWIESHKLNHAVII